MQMCKEKRKVEDSNIESMIALEVCLQTIMDPHPETNKMIC